MSLEEVGTIAEYGSTSNTISPFFHLEKETEKEKTPLISLKSLTAR